MYRGTHNSSFILQPMERIFCKIILMYLDFSKYNKINICFWKCSKASSQENMIWIAFIAHLQGHSKNLHVSVTVAVNEWRLNLFYFRLFLNKFNSKTLCDAGQFTNNVQSNSKLVKSIPFYMGFVKYFIHVDRILKREINGGYRHPHTQIHFRFKL